MWAIFIFECLVVAEFGFCRCVRVFWGLKLVLFFTPILVGFWGLWGSVGDSKEEIMLFLSQKG